MSDGTLEAAAEQRLVAAMQAGDQPAWDAFLDQYDELIRGVVRWTKWHFSHHVQQEVAQQIRTALMRSIPSFKGASSLKHYVKTIAVRQCIAQVRREVRERNIFVPTVIEDSDEKWTEVDFAADEILEPVRAVVLAERIRAVRRLLEELEPSCTTIIRRFFIERLAYKEIGALDGLSIKTVGSRLARCLEKLRALSRKDPELREDFST